MSPSHITTPRALHAARPGTPSPCRERPSADAGRGVVTRLVRALAAWQARSDAGSAEQYLARAADAQDLQVRLQALERLRP